MRILVCLTMLVLLAVAMPAADVNGKWSGSFTVAGGDTSSALIVLKQSGTTVTGTAGPDDAEQWPLTGKIEGNKLTGEVKNPNGMVYKFVLTVSADTLKGNVDATSPEGEPMKGTLDLTRAK